VNRLDLSLPATTLILLMAGLVTLSTAAPELGFVSKQVGFMGLGFVVSVFIVLAGRRRIMSAVTPLYWTSVVLLVLVHLVGTEINGAKSWLVFPPLPGFQPSELAKISLIFALV
jgi:rod shape determining protein RodA